MALKKRTREKEKEIVVKEFDAQAEIEELKARVNRLEHGQFQPAKEETDGEEEEEAKE